MAKKDLLEVITALEGSCFYMKTLALEAAAQGEEPLDEISTGVLRALCSLLDSAEAILGILRVLLDPPKKTHPH